MINCLEETNSFSRAAILALARLRSDLKKSISRFGFVGSAGGCGFLLLLCLFEGET